MVPWVPHKNIIQFLPPNWMIGFLEIYKYLTNCFALQEGNIFSSNFKGVFSRSSSKVIERSVSLSVGSLVPSARDFIMGANIRGADW